MERSIISAGSIWKPNADELWLYFQGVINWVEAVFPPAYYRPEMKGLDFGARYREFGKNKHNTKEIEKEVSRLMEDEDVKTKKGIYSYIFNREERELNIRSFSKNQKREFYERQEKVCTVCKKDFKFEEMEADHITPWSKGGKTIPDNCQVLCLPCNRKKGGK